MMLVKVLCLLLVAATAFCQSIDSARPALPNYRALQAQLNSNRALWRSKGIRCYKQTIRRQCFCLVESLGPFTLLVGDGKILSVSPDNQFSKDLPTVEEVFDRIQKAINDRVASLTVSYDNALGYPTNVFIDQDFRLADEEIGYELTVVRSNDCRASPPKCSGGSILRMFDFGDIFRIPTKGGFRPRPFIRALRRWARYLRSVGCQYKYKLTRSCFCGSDFVGPFIITVENGKIVDAKFEKGGAVPDGILKDLPTITQLFKTILREAADADEVTIKYDGRTGVPTSAAFDRIKMAIDDEITYFAELL